jgi:hypothetical protein
LASDVTREPLTILLSDLVILKIGGNNFDSKVQFYGFIKINKPQIAVT